MWLWLARRAALAVEVAGVVWKWIEKQSHPHLHQHRNQSTSATPTTATELRNAESSELSGCGLRMPGCGCEGSAALHRRDAHVRARRVALHRIAASVLVRCVAEQQMLNAYHCCCCGGEWAS